MRRVGQVLIGLAVGGAVVGGVNLAALMGRANGDLSTGGPLAAALFTVITAVAALGIYFYVRSERVDDAPGPRTETELARRISEALGKSDRVTFVALADALDTDAEAVARLLSELARLEVLPAAVSWQGSTIYPKNRGYLAQQRTCLHCGAALVPEPKSAICPVCGTVHYDV